MQTKTPQADGSANDVRRKQSFSPTPTRSDGQGCERKDGGGARSAASLSALRPLSGASAPAGLQSRSSHKIVSSERNAYGGASLGSADSLAVGEEKQPARCVESRRTRRDTVHVKVDEASAAPVAVAAVALTSAAEEPAMPVFSEERAAGTI